mmetsp:Transcript_44027/g.44536  ORF Transcript_44027/g.44536 Transcript_44027/m.44536 type:complete len:479 (-) Transcript_44027:156-1592(-)|eukprot:CAMPEP_0171296130 /NCGR_PEP_ID=MMETSP0816-20121228/4816_1 /TAXON_ID=420281 /ORGANISM="Proboscia inermis, Strain CCAP1064/1" /LENGTH=478 /DNA_ID=CAMNT_0011769347 /DNA_START=83 /DNA_END=1519 /DNA_ORIENTATION=+
MSCDESLNDVFESTFEEHFDKSEFVKHQDIWEEFVDMMEEDSDTEEFSTNNNVQHECENSSVIGKPSSNQIPVIADSVISLNNVSVSKEVKQSWKTKRNNNLTMVKVLSSIGTSKIEPFTKDEIDLFTSTMRVKEELFNSFDAGSVVPLHVISANPPVSLSTSLNLTSKNKDDNWPEMYTQLSQFHAEYDHCSVPVDFNRNPVLPKWVRAQRTQYKIHCEGGPSCLSQQRISALKDLNFSWSLTNNGSDWHVMLEKLKKFKVGHGHCSVPSLYPDDQKLGRWVSQQRHNYKLKLNGKNSPMTDDRVFALNSIGFTWASGKRDNWKTMYQTLSKFRSEHGNCCVPQNSKKHIKLKNWIYKQRQNYRTRKEGKRTSMSEEQVRKLDSIGFVWSMNRYDDWQCMYEALVEYFVEHGHSIVPVKYVTNPKLGRWTSQQRNDYKLHKEGKTSSMTPARINMLENLGFVWVMKDNFQAARRKFK